ncbi:phosphatidylinositol 4-phosphate 5-kinase 4-like protein isoform X1, partial [Tanacetum coccineum]
MTSWKSCPCPDRSLKPTAFDAKEKIWTKFPSEGSRYTPPHQSCDFTSKGYCTLVFRKRRNLFNMDPVLHVINFVNPHVGRDFHDMQCTYGYLEVTKYNADVATITHAYKCMSVGVAIQAPVCIGLNIDEMAYNIRYGSCKRKWQVLLLSLLSTR